MNTQLKKGLAFGLAAVLVLILAGIGSAGDQKAKININTATAAELENLPRIGPKVAERIVEFRTQNGNFKRIEDIMKVRGIGEKIFDEIKDLITVGPQTQER